MSPNYQTWSKEDLIARLAELELRARAGAHHHNRPKRSGVSPGPSAGGRTFNFKDHPVRKIAVKFCYSGWEYNGLAYQIDPTPLPTVEEVLFHAFAKARLIDPDAGLDGCGWEKCGRTDVGVSAAGQVISLWVRSALPATSADADAADPAHPVIPSESEAATLDLANSSILPNSPTPDVDQEFPSFDLIDEPPSNSSAPPPRTEERHYIWHHVTIQIVPAFCFAWCFN